jgi:hypothetical protein
LQVLIDQPLFRQKIKGLKSEQMTFYILLELDYNLEVGERGMKRTNRQFVLQFVPHPELSRLKKFIITEVVCRIIFIAA